MLRLFNCDMAQDLAALLAAEDAAEGVVSDEDLAFFNKHIADCDDCAAVFDDLKKILADVKNLPEPPLPENFHEGVMERIREAADEQHRIARVKRFRKVYRWVGPVAAAVALVFTGYAIMSITDVAMRVDRTAVNETAPQPAANAPEEYGMAISSAENVEVHSGEFYMGARRNETFAGGSLDTADNDLIVPSGVFWAHSDLLAVHNVVFTVPDLVAARQALANLAEELDDTSLRRLKTEYSPESVTINIYLTEHSVINIILQAGELNE